MTQAARRPVTAQPVLHIGAQQTVVLTGTTFEPQALPLAIGSVRTAAECFSHSPPSPGELEAAIMVVENELSRVPASRPTCSSPPRC